MTRGKTDPVVATAVVPRAQVETEEEAAAAADGEGRGRRSARPKPKRRPTTDKSRAADKKDDKKK